MLVIFLICALRFCLKGTPTKIICSTFYGIFGIDFSDGILKDTRSLGFYNAGENPPTCVPPLLVTSQFVSGST